MQGVQVMKYAINQDASLRPEPKFQAQSNPYADLVAACKMLKPGEWFEWVDAPSKPHLTLGPIRVKEQLTVSAYESKEGKWIIRYDKEALDDAMIRSEKRKVQRTSENKVKGGSPRRLTDLQKAAGITESHVDQDAIADDEPPKLSGSEQLILNCLHKCKRALDASSLINDTKVARSAVYASTSRLVELGLIVVVMIGNTRHWRIA